MIYGNNFIYLNMCLTTKNMSRSCHACFHSYTAVLFCSHYWFNPVLNRFKPVLNCWMHVVYFFPAVEVEAPRKSAVLERYQEVNESFCAKMPEEAKLYIGNISFSTTRDSLRREFDRYGPIEEGKFIQTKASSQS